MCTLWRGDSFVSSKTTSTRMKITKEKLKWIPSILVAMVISMGAAMKLAAAPQLVEIYSKIGLMPYMRLLGTSELLLTGLFLYPRSMKIGLLLLTGYFGGAMAVELSHGSIFIFPAAILSVVWIGAYMRNPVLFSTKQETLSRQLVK
jgi:hypothetical protein